jgi:hypothetical protein
VVGEGQVQQIGLEIPRQHTECIRLRHDPGREEGRDVQVVVDGVVVARLPVRKAEALGGLADELQGLRLLPPGHLAFDLDGRGRTASRQFQRPTMADLRHRRPRMQAKPGCPGGSAEQCTPGHEFASIQVRGGIGGIIAVAI